MLTFELSRFQFNQQLGRPEKIHNKIEFPHVIYMDRFVHFLFTPRENFPYTDQFYQCLVHCQVEIFNFELVQVSGLQ